MPPPRTQAELETIVDAALAERLEGNEYFKSGDLMKALQKYHHVILTLRGLDSNAMNSMGGPTPAPKPKPKPTPKIEEITDDLKNGSLSDSTEKKEDEQEEKAEEEAKPEPTPLEKSKTALQLTYLNMAAVLIKQGKFKRALENAQEVLKLDENNPKAKFREAQARIGMGQLSMGKNLLEELQKKSPDSAIDAELKKLAATEKAGEEKKLAAFHARKPVATLPATTASAGLPTASTSASTSA
ncbi:hypothetical protein RQP46_004045 [Phenoliferia psychrophenolica]